ncbi:MAG TPA: FAD-binding and (Fe-S)-binding domain-containing protein [Chitinophagaceae bacterium]|nr:FAD-binding and (Fe-S)-binding domain-containing protein [Chitinophagaceae bacterium]
MKKDASTPDPRYETKYAQGVDTILLGQVLESKIEGEVRFDDGSRALYATDGSNYRQVPIGVVLPKTQQDIIETAAVCRQYNAPLLSRGCGTSLTGACCNVAVVMDMTKYYNKVLHIDKEKKLVRVQPGIVLDEMRNATQREAGLTFGPDPATHSHCAIGGMLGNNSCGVHSVMSQFYGYGARMSDNTDSLRILTYDGLMMEVGPTSDEQLKSIIAEGGRKGEIYQKLKDLRDKYADLIREKFPKIPRRVSGYDLPALLPENGFNVAEALVGSEGTCVVILEATMKLMPEPEARSLLVIGYPDIYTAGANCPQVMKHQPIGLEGFDDVLIGFMKKKGLNTEDIPLLPKGKGWLLAEFGGKDKNESDAKAKKLMEELKSGNHPPDMHLFDNPDQEKKLWEIRESGLGATAFVPGEPDGAPGWEDSAVPPEKVGDYLRDLRDLFNKYGYHPSLYGHFGQGCIHCRVGFDMVTAEGLQHYKAFTIEASHLVVSYGGSLSGEHGDGQTRGDLLEIMFGKELIEAFKEFKSIWDPQWRMNPGKIIESYGQLSNLRLGTHYDPPREETHFQFLNDDNKGSFARAVLRCVGVGNCRRHEGGTMCPSYMVTREEKDSTRGRAHMLFEMLQGHVVKKGWHDKYVKESLDLCLACKGCKGDCPVNVDMATLKSEFLSHYYKGRIRPRTAYAFGLIFRWARLASVMPGVANFFTHTRGLRGIAKTITGVSSKRQIPKFTTETFRHAFTRNKKMGHGGPAPSGNGTEKPKVILWVDTFNNYFKPSTLSAAVEVLESAGFQVAIPEKILCCGRPLYDFGMLDLAKKKLLEILKTLRYDIRQGVPVVGLEPSCVAVFRDELCDLLPNEQDARRLKEQTFTLAEFLEKKAPNFKTPLLKRKAIVHGHCHQKAIMKMTHEESLLEKMEMDFNILDSGCCGLAGYFGYEKGLHYEVSIRAGERVLLPEVRKAAEETLIIADGFSCREQIEQQTARKGLHLAEVLQMALHEQNYAPDEQQQKEKLAKQETEASSNDIGHSVGLNILYDGSRAKLP